MRIKITSLILFTAIVIAAGRTALAEQSDAQDNSLSQGRIVRFPPDRCMGTLYIQDKGVVNIHRAFRYFTDSLDDKWQILGPAQGDVFVPPGKRLSLYIAQEKKDIWSDLSPLRNLKPKGLR